MTSYYSKVLEYLRKNKSVTAIEICKQLNISNRTVHIHLKKMQDEGKVIRSKKLTDMRNSYYEILENKS